MGVKSTLKTEYASRFWSGEALEHRRKTGTVGQNDANRAAWGITASFGQSGRCSNLANNSSEIPLDAGGGKRRCFRGRQCAFPRMRMVFGVGAGDPQLQVGQVSQSPPVLFMLYLWGLEASQQQSLFAKAEEMFEIKTLVVGGENVQQVERAALLSHEDDPKRLRVSQRAVCIVQANADEGEGIAVHGDVDWFALATHQHVMPGFDLHLIDPSAPTGRGGVRHVVRRRPDLRVLERESRAIPGRVSAGRLSTGRVCLPIEGAGTADAYQAHQVGFRAVGEEIFRFAIAGIAHFHTQLLVKW